ncbi:MAG: hypothetical protein HUU49_05200 [Candidatus Buchananbacteria bacterium]|nr:hypothetical protein [Candidatus Buchananbacteria bacterium]
MEDKKLGYLKTAMLLVFSFFILTGCGVVVEMSKTITQKTQIEQLKQSQKTAAIINCQELCQDKLSTNGIEADDSPCLSNQIIEDWVCDIAHSPRQEIDNLPENQCEAFRTGQAHHFVELDGNCNVIKVY